MPKLNTRNPKYQKHRASGQAVVTIEGRDIYLGPHGTAASRREYDRIIGAWLANGRRASASGATDLSLVEVIAAYWKHCGTYYAAAVAVLAAFVLARPHRWKLSVAVVALLMPSLFARGVRFYVICPIALFFSVPAALLGRSDGEEWSEGFVALGAVGGWVILWLVVAGRLLWSRKRNPG